MDGWLIQNSFLVQKFIYIMSKNLFSQPVKDESNALSHYAIKTVSFANCIKQNSHYGQASVWLSRPAAFI